MSYVFGDAVGVAVGVVDAVVVDVVADDVGAVVDDVHLVHCCFLMTSSCSSSTKPNIHSLKAAILPSSAWDSSHTK